MQYTRYN